VFPAVRALARKFDVDLESVEATGPGGTITRADVERAAKSMSQPGSVEPMRGMRRAMAQRMTAAHAQIVPATVTDEADIDDWPTGEDVTIRLVRAMATRVARSWLKTRSIAHSFCVVLCERMDVAAEIVAGARAGAPRRGRMPARLYGSACLVFSAPLWARSAHVMVFRPIRMQQLLPARRDGVPRRAR